MFTSRQPALRKPGDLLPPGINPQVNSDIFVANLYGVEVKPAWQHLSHCTSHGGSRTSRKSGCTPNTSLPTPNTSLQTPNTSMNKSFGGGGGADQEREPPRSFNRSQSSQSSRVRQQSKIGSDVSPEPQKQRKSSFKGTSEVSASRSIRSGAAARADSNKKPERHHTAKMANVLHSNYQGSPRGSQRDLLFSDRGSFASAARQPSETWKAPVGRGKSTSLNSKAASVNTRAASVHSKAASLNTRAASLNTRAASVHSKAASVNSKRVNSLRNPSPMRSISSLSGYSARGPGGGGGGKCKGAAAKNRQQQKQNQPCQGLPCGTSFMQKQVGNQLISRVVNNRDIDLAAIDRVEGDHSYKFCCFSDTNSSGGGGGGTTDGSQTYNQFFKIRAGANSIEARRRIAVSQDLKRKRQRARRPLDEEMS